MISQAKFSFRHRGHRTVNSTYFRIHEYIFGQGHLCDLLSRPPPLAPPHPTPLFSPRKILQKISSRRHSSRDSSGDSGSRKWWLAIISRCPNGAQSSAGRSGRTATPTQRSPISSGTARLPYAPPFVTIETMARTADRAMAQASEATCAGPLQARTARQISPNLSASRCRR